MENEQPPPGHLIKLDLSAMVSETLAAMPADPEARKAWFAQRRASREKRKIILSREAVRSSAEAFEEKHGIDTWAGDKWWERDMTPDELLDYRAQREAIEARRFEALVEKERIRYASKSAKKNVEGS